MLLKTVAWSGIATQAENKITPADDAPSRRHDIDKTVDLYLAQLSSDAKDRGLPVPVSLTQPSSIGNASTSSAPPHPAAAQVNTAHVNTTNSIADSSYARKPPPSLAAPDVGSRAGKAPVATIVNMVPEAEDDKYARKNPAQMIARTVGNRVSVRKDDTSGAKRALFVLLLIAIFFFTLVEIGTRIQANVNDPALNPRNNPFVKTD